MNEEASKDAADEAVIRRVLSGEVDAFEVLITRYREQVFRIVGRHVPKGSVAEVAHDAFVKAYLSLKNYRATHPFERWLTRIAVRCCHDYWREHFREGEREGPAASDPPAPERDDTREMLDWALGRLNADDRMVLSLVYFEEYSVKECVRVLGWSESKVKVRALRARRKLRELLAELLSEKEV